MIHMQKCVFLILLNVNVNVKVFNLKSRTNETKHTKWHETYINANVDYMQMFVTTSKGGMKINAGVNAKN